MDEGDTVEGPTRISFNIDRDLHDRLKRALPYGMQNHALRQITTILIEAIEREGEMLISAIFSGEITFSITPELRERWRKER